MPSPLRQRQVTVKNGTCVMTVEQAAVLYEIASPRDLTRHEVMELLEQHPRLVNLGVCDFCSERPIVASFPAEDFRETLTGGGSLGAWGACEPCRQLIEAEDHDGLAERCERIFCEREGHRPGSIGVAVFRKLQGEFFAHRTGPAEVVG